jgi:hypothetical protein
VLGDYALRREHRGPVDSGHELTADKPAGPPSTLGAMAAAAAEHDNQADEPETDDWKLP